MKAVFYYDYGPPDILEIRETEKPVPKDNEVLLKVHAVSVNASDWEFLTGRPLYTRMWGLRRPKFQILGSDIAGTVEAVGKKVKLFQPGDEVFGDIMGNWGGFAEYVCAPVNKLILKPADLTFEKAASLPQAALVALQGLRDKGKVQPGQKVLINGAGGGSGTFAIQIAKMLGATVTGVDRTEKLDLMLSIGADRVIDFTKEDFTQNEQTYDVILDFVASHSIFDYRRTLAPRGKYIMVGGSLPHLFQTLLLGFIISVTGKKKMGVLGARPNKDLDFMLELIESNKVVPVIDKRYPLHEVPAALRYLGEGHARGKIIIVVHHEEKTTEVRKDGHEASLG
ncbi:MAG: NAD(P)-dependent alcohol dehydrogenase [bacterium]|nr:MAG: NAD(P)-dependent alcohol dehydrogenase [bacterium]